MIIMRLTNEDGTLDQHLIFIRFLAVISLFMLKREDSFSSKDCSSQIPIWQYKFIAAI